jgi:tellurite resistance protein TerB
MSGFLDQLLDHYKEGMERYQNRPFLRAAMAACALAATASGKVSLRDRVQVDRVLETLDALRVFDPHEGVELFNEMVEAIGRSASEGRELALQAIDDEVAREPDKAELLVRICLAVSEQQGRVPEPDRKAIGTLCKRLRVRDSVCLAKVERPV